MTTPASTPRFRPYRLRRGAAQEITLDGAQFTEIARVAITRGRETYFEPSVTIGDAGEAVLRFEIGEDAIEGFYNVVLTTPDKERTVIRDAFMVLDPEHHDGRYPMVAEYERWNYVIASDGVPMKDMAGSVGFVRHPLVATYFMLAYSKAYSADRLNDAFRDQTIRILDWLEEQLSDGPANSLLVRHRFPLESFQLETGWISGLTQGRVAECFLLGATLFGENKYCDYARRLMEIFHVPVSEGGLLATDRLGLVSIEEYPTEPPSWALNGIGSAIASLETVAHQIDIPWADELIERVCASLEEKIRLFDYPDYPGSKVQLALKHRISFEFVPGEQGEARGAFGSVGALTEKIKNRSGRPATASLSSVTVDAPLSEPYTVHYGDAAAGLATPAAHAGLSVGRAPVWGELMIDGNVDAHNLAKDQRSRLTFRLTCPGPGRLRVHLKDKGADRLIVDAPVVRGDNEIVEKIDWDEALSMGVGRVAKYDEYYHETNLAWMWNISRYGARKPLLHAARRWLLSFHTGMGRIPLNAADKDIEKIAREANAGAAAVATGAEATTPRMRALKAKAESLAFLADALRGDVAAEVVYAWPRAIRADKEIRLHLFGYGFSGDETVRTKAGEAASVFDNPLTDVVSADEIVARWRLRASSPPAGASLEFDLVDGGGKPVTGGEGMRVDIGERC